VRVALEHLKDETMRLESRGSVDGPPVSVALFRLGFGILYLDMALQKAPWVLDEEGRPFGWLYGWIWQQINHPTFEVYRDFLEAVVLPNFTFFGSLSFVTEIALGLSFVLGLFTVLGGLGGALWQINIAVGSYSVPGEWYWIWFLLIVPHLVFAHSRAGRRLGVDRPLRARLAAGEPESRRRRLLLRLT
jgi:thiosulfate dehydrogenase (quinone) large subunit